jgi:hypothetical protein
VKCELLYGHGILNVRQEILRLGGDGTDSYRYRLGHLSPGQFKSLREYYRYPAHQGLPTVEYDAARSFILDDFFHPKMQAALYKSIDAIESPPWVSALTGGAMQSYSVQTNCWSTALDLLSAMESPLTSHLFIPGDDVAVASLLRDPEYSEVVTQFELKPYDYVLYLLPNDRGQMGLDHVAIYAGFGLVFQKTGWTPMDYANVISLEDSSEHRLALNAETPTQIEYRRLKKSFPHPTQVWGSQARGTLTQAQAKMIPAAVLREIVLTPIEGENGAVDVQRIRPIQIVKGREGRYRYDPADPLSSEFEPSQVRGRIEGTQVGYENATLDGKSCKITGSLTVNVIRAKGNSYLVEVDEPQLEEGSSCKDRAGNSVRQFWVAVSNVVTVI